MSKLLKIGIVGCGAIGSSLAKVIRQDFSGKAKISGLYDIDAEKSESLSFGIQRNIRLKAGSLRGLFKASDLIIEATHAKFSYKIAKEALEAGCSIMIMSVGGIIDKHEQLFRLAKRKGRNIYIPSGAVCGLDGLKAASQVHIKSVTLTTLKPVTGFKGLGLGKLKKDKVLFSGRAKDAVRLFPQNINVAATLSLAGIGSHKTRVRIIASPKIKRNIHQVQIVSDAATITTRTENLVHPDNPKTSYLAVLSAVALLRQLLDPVKIGS